MDRQMDCIFITGLSGSGKITLAEQISANNEYSTYISSGFHDVLDDYQGQECIILNNLPSDCLGLSDLLKMLDNHTTSSVKFRYKNKVLECKLIIITTVNNIDTFFKNIFHKKEKDENIIQLQSHFQLHIELDSRFIYFSEWNPIQKFYYFMDKKPNILLTQFQRKALIEREAKEEINSIIKCIIKK